MLIPFGFMYVINTDIIMNVLSGSAVAPKPMGASMSSSAALSHSTLPNSMLPLSSSAAIQPSAVVPCTAGRA